jgi:hypothetical protein
MCRCGLRVLIDKFFCIYRGGSIEKIITLNEQIGCVLEVIYMGKCNRELVNWSLLALANI